MVEKKAAKPEKQDKPAKAEKKDTAGKEKKDEEKKDAKKESKPKKGKGKEDEEVEIVEDEEDDVGYRAEPKPELSERRKKMLNLRKERKGRKPEFKRQEWFRYKKLGCSWRRPRGMHSKTRRHYKYRPNVVSVGYCSPKEVKGLHPSGFEEVMVFNQRDLEGIDPKTQAAMIGHTVGSRKREMILEKADELGIRILNRGV